MEDGKLIEVESTELVELPKNQSMAVMSVINQVALNPQADMSKMEALMKMHEHLEDRDAEKDYWAAMPKLQAELPLIPKNGVMEMTNKAKTAKWNISFATFDDVIRFIRPIMKKHGFSLTFKHKHMETGILTTGIVAHKKGHKEEDEFFSKADNSGSKNEIQAQGSARSYGKRYTAGSLLGLGFGDEDDDGAASSNGTPKPKTYPDESFDKNIKVWEGMILSGDTSIAKIREKCESVGTLTEDQLKRLNEIGDKV